MKRIITLLLAFMLVFTVVNVLAAEDFVTVYAPDGRELSIPSKELEAYENVGWYRSKSDVQKTMYAPDGREIVIYKAEIEAYKNVGWFEDKADVTALMCAPDGRQITVFKSEVQAYKNVGWYLAQSDKIDPAKPMIALTFDDGPMPASTDRILNVLDLYNARATFFVVGSMASQAPDMLKKMDSIDCQIGNHTYWHPDLSCLSWGGIVSELNTTAQVVFDAVGKYPQLLRPPYGSGNATVLYAAGMPSILWSIDTNDWRYRDAWHVINTIMWNVKDGDIILMHDIYGSTASAVENVVPRLIDMGFQLVTVEELARYKNIPLNNNTSYYSIR